MIDQLWSAFEALIYFLWQGTVNLLPRVVLSAIVGAIALFADNQALRAVERAVERNGGRRALALILGRIAFWSVWTLAAIVVLSIWNLDEVVATFIASFGIVGLLAAFALQDITKNFAAGALLALQNPFSIGDRIKVRDFEGVVVDITMRTTALRTADGLEVLVPNADVYASPIINFSHYPRRRHRLALPLPASVPIEAARERIGEVIKATPGPEPEPPPVVSLTGATNDVVTVEISYWLPSTSTEAEEITTQILARLHPVIDELKREAKQAEQAQA